MSNELEILDNGNQRPSGSKNFQLVLFIFACIGFVLKLLYSLYWYGQMSKISSAIGAKEEFGEMIRLFKLIAMGLFFHAIFLFAGALLLFLRRKAGIWLYLTAQLLFFTCMFLAVSQNNSLHRMSMLELIIVALSIVIPAAFILMNLVNRRYWLNRKTYD